MSAATRRFSRRWKVEVREFRYRVTKGIVDLAEGAVAAVHVRDGDLRNVSGGSGCEL